MFIIQKQKQNSANVNEKNPSVEKKKKIKKKVMTTTKEKKKYIQTSHHSLSTWDKVRFVPSHQKHIVSAVLHR